MKKNNKGFFLAETIVVLSLVTTVMAFVYPNVSKLYDNYNSRMNYYDRPEDVLLLKEISKAYKTVIEEKTKGSCGGADNFIGVKKYKDNTKDEITIDNVGDLKKLYITGYMSTPTEGNNYNFNRYSKRMRKVTNDSNAYRLIGVFKKEGKEGKEGKTRYASIKFQTDTYCGVN